MSYPHQDDIEMISEQSVYLRGFLEAIAAEYDVRSPLRRLDIITDCLTNIALPSAPEIKTATAEEINETGDANLAEALAGETELRQTEDVAAAVAALSESLDGDGGSSTVSPVIDATDDVTAEEAIAAVEPTQEQVEAVPNDDRPFEAIKAGGYFRDTFA